MTETSPLDVDLRFDVVDLIGRTGTHRHVERTVDAPGRVDGVSAMQVPKGEPIAVQAELESVAEGIYAHGTAEAHLTGECSRCLDPVEQHVLANLHELFLYPEKVKAADREDSVLLEGDDLDLGPLVRDALAMEADERPLCRPDCPGLCGQCGARLEDDPGHHHDVIDDRFAALQGLFDADEADAHAVEDAPKEQR